MSLLFSLIAGFAALAALLLALLIWRARKPLSLPPLIKSVKWSPLARFSGLANGWATFLQRLAYLSTRREWRYQQQWILLLGQQGAGKSSLMHSVDKALLQLPDQRQQSLAIAGTDWHFLSSAVMIDPEGRLPAAEAGSKAAQEWQEVLQKLDNLRPERPLDGILLVLSARSLQTNSSSQLLALAQALRSQLSLVEQQCEFALPVYVLVSETDAIVGFHAFWQAQIMTKRNQIFGWSMPSGALLDSALDSPSNWLDLAFDSIGERLKALQVQAAAVRERMDASQVDQFFLFPRHFQQLRAPLQQVLSVVFQASAKQSASFCRGLYFTGPWQPANEPASELVDHALPSTDLPRRDIAFIDDLLSQKIMAEPRLARPTRSGIWSRNRLIRQCQIGGLIAFSGLLLALAAATLHLQRQTNTLQQGLALIQKLVQEADKPNLGDTSCMSKQAVFQASEQIAKMQNSMVYWAIPASWLDRRASRESARLIANSALQKVILPGLACRLQDKAQTLLQNTSAGESAANSNTLAYQKAQHELLERSQQWAIFEQQLAHYQAISSQPISLKNPPLLQQFIQLTEYAYQAELPKSVSQDEGALSAALIQAQYLTPLKIPADYKTQASNQLLEMAQNAAQQLSREVRSGSDLLQKLNAEQAPILANTRYFTAWLNWVKSAWSPSSESNNPCLALDEKLALRSKVLLAYAFPAENLQKMRAYFSNQQCYQPAMHSLSKMQMPPYDALFVQQDKQLVLNPKLAVELAGLNALLLLNFMQINDTQPFLCQSKVAGWQASQIGLSNNYVSQYDKFIQDVTLLNPVKNASNNASASSQQPLYQRLALNQLQKVLNSNLNQAQIAVNVDQLVAVTPNRADEQALAQESSAFAGLLEPLVKLQKSYTSNGFSASAAQLSQCLRNYSSNNLARIQNLADASRLYEVSSGTGGGPLFDLGSTPVIKDFLSRQQARSQVLAGYATPFLSYLNQISGPNDAQRSNTQSASYWSNTISELNKYVQFKEPTGQVAQLDNLFLKQMPQMDSSNCSKTLASYQSAEYDNDLFSLRRQKLESQIQASCSGERNAQAASAYNELALRFNRELAGKYPFGPLTSNDASLLITRNFFADYNSQSAALKQSIQGLSGAYWNSVRQFLGQLDASAKFFQGTLNLTPSPSTPSASGAVGGSGDDAALASQAIKLSLTFNAQASQALGNDQLVAWSMSSGSKSAAYPNRASSLDWEYGQALVLDLSWASGSLWRPTSDPSQSDLQVDGVTASYAASGEWALLRMIERHQPSNGYVVSNSNPNRLILEFTPPVVSSKPPAGKLSPSATRLFIGLNLSAKDPKTQANVSLKLPLGFPQRAP